MNLDLGLSSTARPRRIGLVRSRGVSASSISSGSTHSQSKMDAQSLQDESLQPQVGTYTTPAASVTVSVNTSVPTASTPFVPPKPLTSSLHTASIPYHAESDGSEALQWGDSPFIALSSDAPHVSSNPAASAEELGKDEDVDTEVEEDRMGAKSSTPVITSAEASDSDDDDEPNDDIQGKADLSDLGDDGDDSVPLPTDSEPSNPKAAPQVVESKDGRPQPSTPPSASPHKPLSSHAPLTLMNTATATPTKFQSPLSLANQLTPTKAHQSPSLPLSKASPVKSPFANLLYARRTHTRQARSPSPEEDSSEFTRGMEVPVPPLQRINSMFAPAKTLERPKQRQTKSDEARREPYDSSLSFQGSPSRFQTRLLQAAGKHEEERLDQPGLSPPVAQQPVPLSSLPPTSPTTRQFYSSQTQMNTAPPVGGSDGADKSSSPKSPTTVKEASPLAAHRPQKSGRFVGLASTEGSQTGLLSQHLLSEAESLNDLGSFDAHDTQSSEAFEATQLRVIDRSEPSETTRKASLSPPKQPSKLVPHDSMASRTSSKRTIPPGRMLQRRDRGSASTEDIHSKQTAAGRWNIRPPSPSLPEDTFVDATYVDPDSGRAISSDGSAENAAPALSTSPIRPGHESHLPSNKHGQFRLASEIETEGDMKDGPSSPIHTFLPPRTPTKDSTEGENGPSLYTDTLLPRMLTEDSTHDLGEDTALGRSSPSSLKPSSPATRILNNLATLAATSPIQPPSEVTRPAVTPSRLPQPPNVGDIHEMEDVTLERTGPLPVSPRQYGRRSKTPSPRKRSRLGTASVHHSATNSESDGSLSAAEDDNDLISRKVPTPRKQTGPTKTSKRGRPAVERNSRAATPSFRPPEQDPSGTGPSRPDRGKRKARSPTPHFSDSSSSAEEDPEDYSYRPTKKARAKAQPVHRPSDARPRKSSKPGSTSGPPPLSRDTSASQTQTRSPSVALPPPASQAESTVEIDDEPIRVLALWLPTNSWYPGTIERREINGFRIKFDDGSEGVVTANNLRLLRLRVNDPVYRGKKKPVKYLIAEEYDGASRNISVKLPKSNKRIPTKSNTIALAPEDVVPSFDDRVVPAIVLNTRFPVPVSNRTTVPSRKKDILAGMTFVLTGQTVEEQAGVIRSIKAAGGSVEDDWDSLFDVSDTKVSLKPTLHGAPFIIQLGAVELRPKLWAALAAGVPVLAVRYIDHAIAFDDDVDWRSYLVSPGQSSFLGAGVYASQVVDLQWGGQSWDAATAGPVRPFLAGKSVLYIEPSTNAKNATVLKHLTPFCLVAVGATVHRRTSIPQDQSPYDLILLGEDTRSLSVEQRANTKLRNWDWLKNCLLVGAAVPAPIF